MLFHHRIESLPDDLASHLVGIRELGLSDNRFGEFPMCVTEMKSLRKLGLSRNQLGRFVCWFV